MNPINTDNVIQILDVIRESKIDDLRLELPPFKLRVSRHRKEEDGPGKEELYGIEPSDRNVVPIKAPVLGFIRMAPNPGAPPRIEVDRIVERGATLCMIDVLGELHIVKTDHPGRIKEICVSDGQMVEFDQQILLMEKIEHL